MNPKISVFEYFPVPPNVISRIFRDQSDYPVLSRPGNLADKSRTFKDFPEGDFPENKPAN